MQSLGEEINLYVERDERASQVISGCLNNLKSDLYRRVLGLPMRMKKGFTTKVLLELRLKG